MKKFFILAIVGLLIACNNSSNSSTSSDTVYSDTTGAEMDTNQVGSDSARTKTTITTSTDTATK